MSDAALDTGHDLRQSGWVTGAVLLGWFAAVVVANATGAFGFAPDRPPLPLLLAVLGPAVLFGAGYGVSAAVRDYGPGLALPPPTAVQGAVTTEPLQHYPLNLIPTFGVPFWILVHLASLLQLRHLNHAETP